MARDWMNHTQHHLLVTIFEMGHNIEGNERHDAATWYTWVNVKAAHMNKMGTDWVSDMTLDKLNRIGMVDMRNPNVARPKMRGSAPDVVLPVVLRMSRRGLEWAASRYELVDCVCGAQRCYEAQSEVLHNRAVKRERKKREALAAAIEQQAWQAARNYCPTCGRKNEKES